MKNNTKILAIIIILCCNLARASGQINFTNYTTHGFFIQQTALTGAATINNNITYLAPFSTGSSVIPTANLSLITPSFPNLSRSVVVLSIFDTNLYNQVVGSVNVSLSILPNPVSTSCAFNYVTNYIYDCKNLNNGETYPQMAYIEDNKYIISTSDQNGNSEIHINKNKYFN